MRLPVKSLYSTGDNYGISISILHCFLEKHNISVRVNLQ